MKKIYLILLFLGIISFGCEKNITLDIPKYENKVVVYCILQPQQVPAMSLSFSQSYYSYADTTGKPPFISNALVVITDMNTNIKDTLHIDTSNIFKLYLGKHVSVAGHHYIANINYQGKIITSETTIPLPVKIDHIDYVRQTGEIAPGFYDTSYEFHIFFNDLPGEADNYTISQNGENQYSSFTSDVGLDGKQLEIITSMYSPPPTPFTVDFAVDNATKQTSDYLTNVYSQGNSANDPFSQPVIVGGNINGGLGLFGAISPSPYVSVKVVK